MNEEAVLFGSSKSLVGIITHPRETECASNLPAILVLNSGGTYRAGPNRLHVKLARSLAELGYVVMRFDLSGLGDSDERSDNLPFADVVVTDTQEAMDFMTSTLGIEQFMLMGICSGAAYSYRVAHQDSRVVGAILINGRGHLHTGDKETAIQLRRRSLARHYRRIALFSSFSRKNWLRALSGRMDYRKVARAIMNVRLSRLFTRNKDVNLEVNGTGQQIRQLVERGVRLLVIHSEADEGLDYLHVVLGNKMRQWSDRGDLRLEIIKGANHTFTLLWSQDYLVQILCDWLGTAVREEPMVAERQ